MTFDPLQAVKEDVVRSLQSRFELLSEDLRQSSSDEEVKELEIGKNTTTVIKLYIGSVTLDMFAGTFCLVCQSRLHLRSVDRVSSWAQEYYFVPRNCLPMQTWVTRRHTWEVSTEKAMLLCDITTEWLIIRYSLGWADIYKFCPLFLDPLCCVHQSLCISMHIRMLHCQWFSLLLDGILCQLDKANTVHDTRNWTKNASPSRESLKNRETDISRSTNLPHEICKTFWALLMLLGSRGIGILDPRFIIKWHVRCSTRGISFRVLPQVTLARHCPFSRVVYCRQWYFWKFCGLMNFNAHFTCSSMFRFHADSSELYHKFYVHFLQHPQL